MVDASIRLIHFCQSVCESFGVRFDKVLVETVVLSQIRQQRIKQVGIGSRLDGQMQIRQIAGGGAARVDHHDFQIRVGFFGGGHALIQNRVCPGGVAAHQHQQFGLLQIFIAAGHGIGAKGAFVAGHCRGHAQAGIGIQIGAANKTFHQLVGDVVILSQDLPGRVDRNRLWPVRVQNLSDFVADHIQSGVPGDVLASHGGMQQPLISVQCVVQG